MHYRTHAEACLWRCGEKTFVNFSTEYSFHFPLIEKNKTGQEMPEFEINNAATCNCLYGVLTPTAAVLVAFSAIYTVKLT